MISPIIVNICKVSISDTCKLYIDQIKLIEKHLSQMSRYHTTHYNLAQSMGGLLYPVVERFQLNRDLLSMLSCALSLLCEHSHWPVRVKTIGLQGKAKKYV